MTEVNRHNLVFRDLIMI